MLAPWKMIKKQVFRYPLCRCSNINVTCHAIFKKKERKVYLHIVFEEYFVFPFFFIFLTRAVTLHPFSEIPVLNY